MNKLFTSLLLFSSTFCAADHFDYYEFMMLESHLSNVENKIEKYRYTMDEMDYFQIIHDLNASKKIVYKKVEDYFNYEK